MEVKIYREKENESLIYKEEDLEGTLNSDFRI